jgi:hypothetical protein
VIALDRGANPAYPAIPAAVGFGKGADQVAECVIGFPMPSNSSRLLAVVATVLVAVALGVVLVLLSQLLPVVLNR